jgi:hypothetical protein
MCHARRDVPPFCNLHRRPLADDADGLDHAGTTRTARPASGTFLSPAAPEP